jgi:hypothetical protein
MQKNICEKSIFRTKVEIFGKPNYTNLLPSRPGPWIDPTRVLWFSMARIQEYFYRIGSNR